MKPLFLGKVIKNKIELFEKEKFQVYINKFENKEIQLTIELKNKKRSNQENRYYWGIVLEILSNHTGHTPDELHECFRAMFLKIWINIGSKEIESIRSTTDLSTVEMEQYLTKIREFASIELNVYIPLPNEMSIG